MATIIDGHFARLAVVKSKPADAQRLAKARVLMLQRLRQTKTECDVESERQSLEIVYNLALRAAYAKHSAGGTAVADLIIDKLLDEMAVLLVLCRQMQGSPT